MIVVLLRSSRIVHESKERPFILQSRGRFYYSHRPVGNSNTITFPFSEDILIRNKIIQEIENE